MKLLMSVLALFMIVGCSSEPTKPVETEKPKQKAPELVTG